MYIMLTKLLYSKSTYLIEVIFLEQKIQHQLLKLLLMLLLGRNDAGNIKLKPLFVYYHPKSSSTFKHYARVLSSGNLDFK